MKRSAPAVAGQQSSANSAIAVQKVLKSANRLLASGAVSSALREIDRAWRTMPKHAATLAPLLGRALLIDGQAVDAAVKILSRAAQLAPSAEAEAALIEALLRLRRTDLAQQRLAAALQAYASDAGSVLADAARHVVAQIEFSGRAWAVLTPDMKLYAERTGLGATVFQLWSAEGQRISHQEVNPDGDRASCLIDIPDIGKPQFVHLTANGQPVLGGDRILPMDFRLDARCSAIGRRVEGWAHLGWNPRARLELLICDEAGRCKRVGTAPPKAESPGTFSFDADTARLGNRLTVHAVLPDGRKLELPDSPLLFKPELDAQLRKLKPRPEIRRQSGQRKRPAVDIVIPVYQGHEETMACINAVLQTASDVAASVIVVDDASPDTALSADLDALADAGHITLLRNAVNLGFSGSVNRAIALHDSHDVVLVNADAVVFGDWLSRLRKTAYSAARIATVTPFADDDSVVSYSDGRADSASAPRAADLDAYAAEAHRGIELELPVGVGFCMYIRREAWREVGELDAAVFGKGYGEESDWCMRARKLGWQHRLAADVFVHHAGGRSFGTRRQALLERAQRLMNLRHAGYDRYVQRFLKADELQPLRRNFDAHQLREIQQPIVLIVTLALTGGVDRFVGERCKKLQKQGKFPLVLRPQKIGPDACMLWSFEPRLPHLHYQIPDELKTLKALLHELPIESVEFHHFLGLDARLVQVALQLGVLYDAYLHDYSWICPRVTLMDHSGQYCGEPNLAACERCVRRNGSDLMETKKISVAALRARSRRWLRGARRVIAPSRDVATRFGRRMPELSISIEPLETGILIGPRPARHESAIVKVALLGAIGEHKGYQVLLRCVQDARMRRLPLEFVVIGYSQDDAALARTGKVFVTGEYMDSEVPGLLRRESPDLIWLPSVWPETWCYTLTHALASGLPVVAFDIGAIAERMRAIGLGELMQLGLPATQINDRLLQIAAESDGEASLFN